jgi:hypothetical protein
VEDRKYRTKFALRALDLGDVFNAQFADFVLAGRVKRHVTLSVPEGQSTAGGTQANQSISLVAEDPAAGTLVAGTVNSPLLTAELRGFPYVNETHRLRYHRPLDIPAGAYQQFLTRAETVLKANGFTVTVVNQLPDSARRRYQPAKPASSSATIWVIFALLLLAGGAAAAYLLLNR